MNPTPCHTVCLQAVCAKLAQLLPFFACGNDTVRSRLVRVVASVLGYVSAREGGDERAQAARVVTRQHCIELLMERCMDKSARVR